MAVIAYVTQTGQIRRFGWFILAVRKHTRNKSACNSVQLAKKQEEISKRGEENKRKLAARLRERGGKG